MSKGNLPFVSLNAVTTVGPGISKDLEDTAAYHSMMMTVTGGYTKLTVAIEGSLDGTVWFTMGSFIQSTPGPSSAYITVSSASVSRYIRANIIELVGGTSPAVTATLASY